MIRILCLSCQKHLRFQRVALIKCCGHCNCEQCMKSLLGKDEKCPCGKAFIMKEDIIYLEESKSGYSYHNKVVAETVKPTFVC